MLRTRTVAATAAGVVLGVGMLGVPANAQQAELGTWTVAQGEPFTISGGDSCLPDPEVPADPVMSVVIAVDSVDVATVTPDEATGAWSATVTATQDPGTYPVAARCLQSGLGVADVGNGTLVVTDDEPDPTDPTDPTDPADPTDPTDPTPPGDQPGPGDPTDPSDPSDTPGDPGADDDDDGDDTPAPGEPAPPVNGDPKYTG